MDNELKECIRTEFDTWREALPEGQREHVEFGNIDGYLNMLFVTVDSQDFDVEQVGTLENALREQNSRLAVGIEDHRPSDGQ